MVSVKSDANQLTDREIIKEIGSDIQLGRGKLSSESLSNLVGNRSAEILKGDLFADPNYAPENINVDLQFPNGPQLRRGVAYRLEGLTVKIGHWAVSSDVDRVFVRTEKDIFVIHPKDGGSDTCNMVKWQPPLRPEARGEEPYQQEFKSQLGFRFDQEREVPVAILPDIEIGQTWGKTSKVKSVLVVFKGSMTPDPDAPKVKFEDTDLGLPLERIAQLRRPS